MDNYESAPLHSECEITQAVLSGASSLTWFSLPHAEAHWHKCLECQSRFPEGIADGKRALKENVKDSIARTYHAFMSKKHSVPSTVNIILPSCVLVSTCSASDTN
jgi:hypothetical protein